MTDFYSLPGLKQVHLDWLISKGVTVDAMIKPEPMRFARGSEINGRFLHDRNGADWFAFAEGHDIVYWRAGTNKLATETGAAFALGQEVIDLPETYAFDCYCNIFADPLEWLQAGRDGVVVLDWSRTWARFHAVPRVALTSDPLAIAFDRHFKPPRGPDVVVMRVQRRAAA